MLIFHPIRAWDDVYFSSDEWLNETTAISNSKVFLPPVRWSMWILLKLGVPDGALVW